MGTGKEDSALAFDGDSVGILEHGSAAVITGMGYFCIWPLAWPAKMAPP
jgi:hypothetical protein